MVLERLKHVENPTYVRSEPLTDFVASLFSAAGMPADEARQAADVLVDADLNGIDTHGVGYNIEFHYLWGLSSGHINPTSEYRVVHETPSTAVVDADRGMGLVVGQFAMKVAIDKAQVAGSGCVAVPNSSHFGPAGYYARMALPHDMIGVTMSSGGPIVVVPTFGRDPWMGTNPIAVAAPAGSEPPFVLDMATSTVAYGKLAIAAAFGVEVPDGWALDDQGRPLTSFSSTEAIHGQPPLGGTREQGSQKGFGLAMVADILGAVLPGERVSGLVEGPRNGRFCHYFQAIRVDAFRPVADFKADMDEMLRAIVKLPTAAGHDRVLYPGLPEHEEYQKRIAGGIPLPENVIAYLKRAADEMGVPYTL